MAKIAIVGTGISGLGAAFLLHPSMRSRSMKRPRASAATAAPSPSTMTARRSPVDTGFIVFNKPNYPNLTGLFAHLGVPTHKSDMTFSASIRDGWLEWGAKDTNAVFGQRRNLLRPRFGLLVRDVMKFNAQARSSGGTPSRSDPGPADPRAWVWATGSGAIICCPCRARSGVARPAR